MKISIEEFKKPKYSDIFDLLHRKNVITRKEFNQYAQYWLSTKDFEEYKTSVHYKNRMSHSLYQYFWEKTAKKLIRTSIDATIDKKTFIVKNQSYSLTTLAQFLYEKENKEDKEVSENGFFSTIKYSNNANLIEEFIQDNTYTYGIFVIRDHEVIEYYIYSNYEECRKKLKELDKRNDYDSVYQSRYLKNRQVINND